MKSHTRKVLLYIAGSVFFFLLLGVAGNYDYAEEVVYDMPQPVYDNIVSKLGDDASIIDIADEYMDNRSYYDSLSK